MNSPTEQTERKQDWVARFFTPDSHLLDTVRYQNCTMQEAHKMAEERAQYYGNRCDDYSLNEDTHPQNR